MRASTRTWPGGAPCCVDGGSSSTKMRYVRSTGPGWTDVPTRTIRCSFGARLSKRGKKITSVVGESCIWPVASWAHAKAFSWKRSGSVLVFWTVRMALRVCAERKIWIGLTVKSAAPASVAARAIHSSASAGATRALGARLVTAFAARAARTRLSVPPGSNRPRS